MLHRAPDQNGSLCQDADPVQVDFGTVVVSCTAVREKLVATQRDLIARLTKLLLGVPRAVMQATTRKYRELQTQLMQATTSIEDVDEQRALIESLPNKIQEVVEEMEAAQPWCACSDCAQVPFNGTATGSGAQ